MPQLDLGTVRYSEVLKNISLAYKNDMFVGDQFFPTVPSKNDTGIYYERGRENFHIDQAYRRPGTEANQVYHSYTPASYITQEYALKEALDDKVINNAIDPLRPKADATEVITEKLRLAKEDAILALISDYTTTFASYNQAMATYNAVTNPNYVYFDDYTNSDPAFIIGLLVARMQQVSGKTPNVIGMNISMENVIANNPKTKQRFQYVQSLNTNALPDNFLGLKMVRCKAVKDTQNPGQSTAVTSWMMPNVLFLGYVESSPGINKISVGYTFEHKSLNVKEWYDDKISSIVIQVSWDYVIKVIAAKCGFVAYDLMTP